MMSFLKNIVFASLFLFPVGAALANTDTDKNPVVQLVKTTVEKEKLVSNPVCTEYLFTPDAEEGLDRVDVMEKHGGKCGLDPQIQHRLFSVLIDQKTHQMLSDKDDLENGTMALLPPAK